MNYEYRKAYREMVKKEIETKMISEEVPAGAMDSGSYLQTSLSEPSDKNAIYVAFKNDKCKKFPCPITRRQFLESNPDWKALDEVKEEIEFTFEENLFWEEVSALYINENGEEMDDASIDMFLEGEEDIELEDETVNESVIKSWIKRGGRKILRMVSSKKGWVVKKSKTGIAHEVKLTPDEVKKRKAAAKRSKKYYKKKKRSKK